MRNPWKALPDKVRRWVGLGLKALLTLGSFSLLFMHRVPNEQGEMVSIGQAIRTHLGEWDVAAAVPFLLAGTTTKFVGILSSMLRWQLLLIGQGIRFNFGHVFGSFLIGRFLGTFLPSTVGLDSYKLYDAARFSDRVVEPAAATAVEKVLGMSGLFLCFLVTLPFGFVVLYDVLGDAAPMTIGLTVTISTGVVGGLFLLLVRPRILVAIVRRFPALGRRRLESFVQRAGDAAAAYQGKPRLLAAGFGLSFLVHFTTAAMYYFTAMAVGVVDADFWQITFASSIQIFATVLSPFTVAGEGIREIAQTWLLKDRIGAGQAVLSAALGFWAAEALTLLGAVFLWIRPRSYRPKLVEVNVRDAGSVVSKPVA